MSLRWFFRPDWVGSHAATEFTDNVRLYTLDVTENAEEGSVAMSTILVDDPEGALDFPPLTRIWATETEIAASSNTYVYHGYIAERVFHRGDSLLTSAARVIEVNAADENSMLSRRVLSSGNSNRPAETDVARVLWICNNADGQLLIDDTTFVSTASPVSMDAADYRGQTALDVLNDCAQASGKNFYAYFNQAVGTGVWYGAEDLTTHTSMVRLTNVLGDIDNNLTFAISEDTQLTRDPSRLVSGVYFQGATPQTTVYVRNNAMFPFITVRDQVHSNANVKTTAKAQARANRYLNDNDTEDDRIVTSVRLPAAKVNWIKAGMRIQFRASHLPGYQDDYVWMRVLRRSVAQDSETEYLLRLELGTDTVPDSVPGEAAAGSVHVSANLEIGSASFIGEPSDREEHWGSEVGAGPVTITQGREYRLVGTIVSNMNSPLGGYENMNAFTYHLNAGTASAADLVPPTGDWTPDACTTISQGGCFDGGISFAWTVAQNSGELAPGTVYTGDWLRFDGPTQTGDISISGAPISGFFGFHVIVHLELQER